MAYEVQITAAPMQGIGSVKFSFERVNVLLGANGSGKSRFLQAIRDALNPAEFMFRRALSNRSRYPLGPLDRAVRCSGSRGEGPSRRRCGSTTQRAFTHPKMC